MSQQANMDERLASKTPAAVFLHILRHEFNFSTRVASAVLGIAQEVLSGNTVAGVVRPGQIRLLVASLQAPFGPMLAETDKVEVTLTVDSGVEDSEVKRREGAEAQRRGRILRILEEALEQGGVLTQEDLARALGVERRTIARDVKQLKAEGHLVHTRGQVKGVGRGQTHKVRIIELWLNREGYDRIARWVHHSPQAIQRYVSTFVRLVILHRAGRPVAEIAFLTRCSERLVQDYLAVYERALTVAHRRTKLEEEIARVSSWSSPVASDGEKGGARP